MASTRTISSRTRLLIVAGLAAAGIVGGAAGWAPAVQAGVTVPIVPVPSAGDDVIRTVKRHLDREVVVPGGCDSCTPGIVVPIGPVPIGPAGDDLIQMVEGAVNRDVRVPRP